MEKYLAKKITNWCQKTLHIYGDDEKSVSPAVIQYGLELLLNNVLKFLFMILIAVFFGKVFETVICMAAFGMLRYFAGGSHRSSSFGCFLTMAAICILSVIAASIAPLLLKPLAVKLIAASFSVMAIILIWIFAPRQSEKNPIHDMKVMNRKKIGARIVAVVLGMLVCIVPSYFSLLMAIPALYESITVIPYTRK